MIEKPMKYWRVGIFASVNVTAEDEYEAIREARHMVIDGAIKTHDYEFEAQDRELDSDLDFVEMMAKMTPNERTSVAADSMEMTDEWPERVNVSLLFSYQVGDIADQLATERNERTGDGPITFDMIMERVESYVQDDFNGCSTGDLIFQDEDGNDV